jgi:hypothetical protein
MGPWWFAAARRAVIESQGSIPHALEARLRQLRGVGIPMSAAENSFFSSLVPKLVIEAVERPEWHQGCIRGVVLSRSPPTVV